MDAVHLLLSGLDSSKRYQLYVVYLNKDNASAVGGSRQQLVTDDGVVVHSALTAPTSKPGLFSFSLPQSSYQDGTITLQLERMSGYRVALSELLLIELTSEDADAPEVSVQSPAEGAYLNGSHVVVSGTSSDNIAVEDRWLTIQSNESSTQYAMSSVQSDGNWQFNWPLPEDGIYQLSAGARDASGHRGYSDQLTVQVDNTAPTAVRYVTVYDTPADAGSSITLTWPASSDAGSGVAGYRITRRLASGGSVQTLGTVSADLNTYQDASAVTGTEYIYTVTTEDKAGNQSTAIDSSTIAAIDNSLEDIIAPEEVTNFTAVASNESVRLTWTASQNSANDLISQWLDYSTDGGANWSTVEALDVSLTQYQFSNLQNDTAYRFRLRMVDAANPANVSAGVISDTVTPSETAYIEVSGTFSEDIDWLAGTYRVTGDVVVPAGITLTVHPNAIIKFNADRKLTVNGVLNVVGSSGNEAVFTSWQDDEYGGDTNGDGASQGQAGDWRHIALIDGEANIDYAIIRFAGQDASVDEALYAYQSPLSLTHSTIEYSGDRAIKVSEDRSGQSLSATLIDHNTLRHNYRSAIYLYHRYGSSTDPAEITNNQIEDNDNTAAIDLQNVNAKIQGNTIRNNEGHGIYFSGTTSVNSTTDIRDNVFDNNEFNLRVPIAAFPSDDANNRFENSRVNYVRILSGTLTRDIKVGGSGLPVIRHEGGEITIAAGAALRLEPGTVWKSDYGRLNSEGSLVAVGTASQPITFTSYQDDSVGGDTNGDGEASQGAPGQWRGIRYGNGTLSFLSRLAYVHVQNAGNNNYSAIELYRNGVVIENSVIRNNQDAGIYLNEDGTNVLRNNQIQNNNYGIYASGNYGISALIEGNTLEDNRTDGIYFRYTVTAQVKDNVIRNNGRWGLYWDRNNSAPIIMGNTITGNALGVRLPASAVPNPSDGNTLTPNTRNAVWIIGGTRSTDLILPLMNAGQADELSQYRVEGQLLMNTGTTLTVQPGVILKFADNAQLYMHGTLVADGTEEQPIIFTDYRDDRWGGDLNADGLSTGLAGAWQGIEFSGNTTESNVLDHIQVHYAGRNVAGIYANSNKPLTVSHSLVSNSGNEGIRVRNTDLTLTNVDLIGNGSHGLRLHYGTHQLSMQGGRVFANGGWGAYFSDAFGGDVEGVEFFANGSGAITNRGSAQVDARGNWWGALDGPSGDEAGSGDAVSNTSSGSLTVSDLFKGVLADGSEFAYFNGGGDGHMSFGLTLPIVSGSSSTEFGTSPNLSHTQDIETKEISVAVGSLKSDTAYEVYLNLKGKSGEAIIESFETDDLQIIENALVSTGKPTFYVGSFNTSSFSDDELRARVVAESGLRAILQQVVIVEAKTIDTTAPIVSITTPETNSLINSTTVELNGQAFDSESGLSQLILTVQHEDETVETLSIDQLNQSGRWIKQLTLHSQGEYSFRLKATNGAGRISQSERVVIKLDTLAPEPATSFLAIGEPGKITLDWAGSESEAEGDVDHYLIAKRLTANNTSKPLVSVSAGTSRYQDIEVETDVEYVYSVVAVDAAGNRSTEVESGSVSASESADIVAPEPVSQLNVQVSGRDSLTGTAYLTWTASENSLGDLSHYEVQVSRDSGSVFGSNYPEFDNSSAFEVDRSRTQFSIPTLDIGRSYLFQVIAVDLAGNRSLPAQQSLTISGQADEYIDLSGTLTSDTHLSRGVYVLSGLTIETGTKFSVEAGTIFKMKSGTKFTVKSDLELVGTSDNPIIFTSYTDDSVGGDTNGDGSSDGSAGYWRQIHAINTQLTLSNIEVRFAGYGNDSALYAENTQLMIDSLSMTANAHKGVYAYNSETIIENSKFTHHANDWPVYIYKTDVTNWVNKIRNNEFSSSYGGVYFREVNAIVDSNKFTDLSDSWAVYFYENGDLSEFTNNSISNVHHSIVVPANAAPDSSNTFTNISREAILLRGQNLKDGQRFQSFDSGNLSTYVVISSDMVIPSGAVVTVDPGVNFKFDTSRSLKVYGALVADGKVDQPVTFTSYRNDSVGGDSNDNGNDELHQAGNWGGLQFYQSNIDELTVLDNFVVSYGGSGSAALHIDGATVDIENCSIYANYGNGIYLNSTATNVKGCRIWGNNGYGIYSRDHSGEISFNRISGNKSDGVYIYNNAPVVSNNDFIKNRASGIYNRTSTLVSAVNNWWGDIDQSGPNNASSNSLGTGDKVSGNVTFSPYSDAASIQYQYTNFSAAGYISVGNISEPVVLSGEQSDEWGTDKDKSMLFDKNEISIRFDNLASDTRYKIRVIYYNGDSAASWQSLNAGTDKPIHDSFKMPTTASYFEFKVPATYYESGTLELNFVHDNPENSVRAALSELWLIEDEEELAPARFEKVEFNDTDGSGTLTVGDQYWFSFSDPLNPDSIIDGATDANEKLAPATGVYGEINKVEWVSGNKTVIVTLTDGFTVTGNELVTVANITDELSKAVAGSQTLTLQDSIAPELMSLTWQDNDQDNRVSEGDLYRFEFSEVLNTQTLLSGGTDANNRLRPEGGKRYGDAVTVNWSEPATILDVQVSQGFTVVGNEWVYPSQFLTDVAGNSVGGRVQLQGKDEQAPELLTVVFDDRDGNENVSVGDAYIFTFSEAMDASGISDNTTEANANLSPAGKLWGTRNSVTWNATFTELTIQITDGFTINGTEEVVGSSRFTDPSNNSITGSISLTLQDSIAPVVEEIKGTIASPVPNTNRYRLRVQFSSTMNSLIKPTVSITADAGINPEVSENGHWLTTKYPNDTYETQDITISDSSSGLLHVSVSGGEDQAGNSVESISDGYQFAVLLTGPAVASHSLAPVVNQSNTKTVALTGSRRSNTEIWINNTLAVSRGSEDWNATISLIEGDNRLEIIEKDVNQTPSDITVVIFNVDTTAPQVSSVNPVTGSFINKAPESVSINFFEDGLGIKEAFESVVLKRNDMVVNGQLSWDESAVTFTADGGLLDGHYSLILQLQDKAGNLDSQRVYEFDIDRIAPDPVVLDILPENTTVNQLVVSGSKAAYDAVYINGDRIVENTASLTWSYTMALAVGENDLSLVARDRAGNVSEPVNRIVVLDDQAPGVVVPSINADLDGQSVELDWTTYDAFANGNDIEYYKIFIASAEFTQVNQATLLATLSDSSRRYTATGLKTGQEYFFAVVAVDETGNQVSSLTSVSATPRDSQAPGGIDITKVTSYENQVLVEWVSSTATDLSEYRIYLGSVLVESTQATSFVLTGLDSATGYDIAVTAVDTSNNESIKQPTRVSTLLENPSITSIEALNNRLDISWSMVTPSDLVAGYKVYVEKADFADVTELNPRLTVSESTMPAGVTGLENDTPYFVAVTAVNISGGESTTVVTTTATPLPDQIGPELENIKYGSEVLVESMQWQVSDQITLKATDPSGISRIELLVNDSNYVTDAVNTETFKLPINLLELTDGAAAITIKAFDTLENVTEVRFNIVIDLAPPAAPLLTAPSTGLITNQDSVQVEGTGAIGSQAVLNVNGTLMNSETIGFDGEFSLDVPLQEGENQIAASALYPNRTETGNRSASITVTRDASLPNAPGSLRATAYQLGVIQLSWSAVADAKGYNLYRSTSEFSDKSVDAVVKVNSSELTATTLKDTLINDDEYFYAVTAVNDLGTESNLSELISQVSDSIGPRVLSVNYEPQGAYDPVEEHYGAGIVSIRVMFSEILRNEPYFAIVPAGGVPIAVDLSKSFDDDRVYSGQFTIEEGVHQGDAYAVMSAHDLVGNRGTAFNGDDYLYIDAKGPDLIGLILNPNQPIQNSDSGNGEGQTISIRATLSNALSDGDMPLLVPYVVGGSNDGVIASYEAGIPLALESETDDTFHFVGEFILPLTAGINDSGEASAELLNFNYSATDKLGNNSERILVDSSFQVYQGALPPLSPPNGVAAKALPNGSVEVSWNSIGGASAYQVLRRISGETTSEIVNTIGSENSFVDDSLSSGTLYEFAIASVRRANAQEAISAPSDWVSVAADAEAPNAPTEFNLELNGAGIVARWEAPTDEPKLSDIRYNLYRLNIGEFDTVDLTGIDPIQTNIPELIALDASPSESEHAYVVTAVDAAGNESLASNMAYLNFELLPVSQLLIEVKPDQLPLLSWQHSGSSIKGYKVFSGESENLTELTTGMLTEQSYSDISYNGSEIALGASQQRTYTIFAVDNTNNESIGHTLRLPALTAEVQSVDGEELNRGVMNRMTVRVYNHGTDDATGVTLYLSLDDAGVDRAHRSDSFSVNSGEFTDVEVIVGGYDGLDALSTIQLLMEQTPKQGETVRIYQNYETTVGKSGLVATLATDNFVRGATGTVYLTIENTSAVETEVLVAKSNGNSASDELRVRLLDADENVLMTQAIQQYSGNVVTLSNGDTVARIAAGETFTSNAIEIPVPQASPDEVQVKLEIDNFHYHSGQATHVEIEGTNAFAEAWLLETPYFAEVTSLSAEQVFAGDVVTLTGKAVSRATNLAAAYVPLNLVLSVRGFEIEREVTTDGDGHFSFEYQTADQDSGEYQISVIHPSVLERPKHATFTVVGAKVSPSSYNVAVPFNYVANIPLTIQAGYGSELKNVYVKAKLADGQSLPVGIAMEFPDPVSISARQKAVLKPTFTAANNAADSGQITLQIMAEGNESPLVEVPVNYELREAVASLVPSPTFVATGLQQNDTITESVQLANKGYDDFYGMTVSLTNTDGTSAPDWMTLITASSIGELAVGEQSEVLIKAAPDDAVSEGIHQFYLHIATPSQGDWDLPISVTVAQSGIGASAFHISDIYTSTFDSDGQLIPGLQGAKIKLTNELVPTLTYEQKTDQYGETIFVDLPAGRYTYRASAFDHESATGRIWIKAGITIAEQVFLMNELVSVDFSVKEISLEDRYEIKLEATYETAVPAAVVKVEPMIVNLPVMHKGEVFHGELRYSNLGLISAEHIDANLPEGDEFASFEYLKEFPETLAAGEVFVMPYRVTALQEFDPDLEGDATGGGCTSHDYNADVNYDMQCASDYIVAKVLNHFFTSNSGSYQSCNDSSSGGGSSNGGWSSVGGGGSGSWSGSSSPLPKSDGDYDSLPECVTCSSVCESCDEF